MVTMAGCSATAQAGPTSGGPTAASLDAEVPGVTRASAEDRQVVAETMQTATDYYATTVWNLAEICSKYPSALARSKDSNYSNLIGLNQINKVQTANEKILPLIMAKNTGDYNVWMDWSNKVNSLSVDLEFWGAGTVPDQDLKAKATKDLADARSDIQKLRQ